MRAQFGKASLRAPVMDEHTARFLPEVTVRFLVIDKNVACFGMIAFVPRHGRYDSGPWKVQRRPADLLVSCPVASRKAGKNYRIQMLDGVEKLHGVRQQRKAEVEVRRLCQPLPEAPQAMALPESAGRHAEHRGSAPVKVSEHAIAIEVKLPQLACSIAQILIGKREIAWRVPPSSGTWRGGLCMQNLRLAGILRYLHRALGLNR